VTDLIEVPLSGVRWPD